MLGSARWSVGGRKWKFKYQQLIYYYAKITIDRDMPGEATTVLSETGATPSIQLVRFHNGSENRQVTVDCPNDGIISAGV